SDVALPISLWPAICELLKFIASTFHLGPYSI
ncbi:hypothetical protein, partial [Salmonella enterica]